MTIAVLADDIIKNEWERKGVPADTDVLWCGSAKTLVATVADVYMDMSFEFNKERIAQYGMRSGYPFFVNAVEHTTEEIGNSFIRINAWPGFLERKLIEISVNGMKQEEMAKAVLKKLHWNYCITGDLPGMITGRIIAGIINEAYFTYGDGVSSKEEIDIAMKLGTSYPFGPFEWSEKIGLDKIYNLLAALHKTDTRYVIAPALEEEIRKT